jgi:hypothetical protein
VEDTGRGANGKLSTARQHKCEGTDWVTGDKLDTCYALTEYRYCGKVVRKGTDLNFGVAV